MKIRKITKIKLDKPMEFYDITVEKYHNFSITDSKIIVHNSSLGNAISRLAKEYGCSYSLLNGDGFFGNSINNDAAATRYTSVSLDKKTHELISKYNFLNEKSEQGGYLPLHVEFPLGLLTTILGIAVGYKTTVLPRKIEEIQKYVNGKKANLNPYFKNFNGNISSFEELQNSWLFEGEYKVENNTISITSIPPMMNYKSFLTKLDKLIAPHINDINIINNSKDFINIKLIFKNSTLLEELQESIVKITKQIVKENLVFIKDSSVLEYDCVEDYLKDFINYRKQLYLKNYKWQVQYFSDEIEFLLAKLEYFKFMKSKKDITNTEIENFLNKYNTNIYERLSRILLKSLNQTEETDIKLEIEKNQKFLEDNVNLAKEMEIEISKTDFKLRTRNIVSKLIESSNVDEVNNVELFKIEDMMDDNEDDDNT